MRLSLLIVPLALHATLSALPLRAAPAPEPWDHFFENVGNTFSGDRLWLHAVGVGSTALLVATGGDAATFELVRERPELSRYTRPAVRFGDWAPAYLGGPLLFHGLIRSDSESLGAASAVAQSTVIAVSSVTLLKALTGRPDADVGSSLSAQEQSRTWRFGILRGGVYDGWPSGHVGTTTAAIATLMHYYPDQSWMKWAGYPMIGMMVFSVTAHGQGQMHWLSESITGALLGYAIGWTVGSRFRQSVEETSSPAAPALQFSLSF